MVEGGGGETGGREGRRLRHVFGGIDVTTLRQEEALASS